MKIGILTFHRAINYGAVLQCYALSEILKSMGHKVDVIDYRPESIERYRMFCSYLLMKKMSFSQRINYLLISTLLLKQRITTNRKFDCFLKNNFSLSHKKRFDANTSICDYDVIFFGSDQIWNKVICYGHDKVYWGQFPHANTKLVTYAASMGSTSIYSADDIMIMQQYIKSYDRLSVREVSLQKYLKETLHVDSTLVSDPTFLIDKSIYERISVKPKFDKYVLLFVLEGDYKGALNIAKSLADQLNCPVIHLSAMGTIRKHNDGVIHISNLSPEEFLGYYQYATCCVGISFHATAFSLIFRKDFYCVSSPMQDRSLNLMKTIGVPERLVKVGEDVKFSPIDYSDKEQNYEQLRASSLQYLREVTQ